MKVTVRTMAKEMMEFTKNNIHSQAAQAMLAQFNRLQHHLISRASNQVTGNRLEQQLGELLNILKCLVPQRNWKQ